MPLTSSLPPFMVCGVGGRLVTLMCFSSCICGLRFDVVSVKATRSYLNIFSFLSIVQGRPAQRELLKHRDYEVDLDCCLGKTQNREDYFNICKMLYAASVTGDWEAAKNILDRHPKRYIALQIVNDRPDNATALRVLVTKPQAFNRVKENLATRIIKSNMLLYSWDGCLDVCVNLTGSSPLTQTGMADFVPNRAVIDAAQRKRVKYMAKIQMCESDSDSDSESLNKQTSPKCAAIGYGFLPFSFSSLEELEEDAVTL
ncbi:hypothetical protein Tco_0773497 [Tanacetum coccineum]|uniref:Uncharacterized protein n=1 Tax=Tanacetum coccineum TaxID=301880 RepID=A0ABQ4ZM92_9ASTR